MVALAGRVVVRSFGIWWHLCLQYQARAREVEEALIRPYGAFVPRPGGKPLNPPGRPPRASQGPWRRVWRAERQERPHTAPAGRREAWSRTPDWWHRGVPRRQELAFLGMASSPSFVREPEGNGVAERFIRTLKENLLWVRTFATVAELVEALREFRRRYNEQWLIERHGYRTPSQARSDACRGSKPLETGARCRRVG